MVTLMRLAASLRRFVTDRSAVAAIEFVLVAPIMLTLYLGGLQLSDALTINRKVTHVSSTLGDLITQEKSLTNSDVTKILDITSAIMTPYSAAPLQIRVSEITIKKGKATVVWSRAKNFTALNKGDPIAVPDTLMIDGTYLVTAEIHYAYTPAIGYGITGTFDLHDSFFLRPRTSDDIPCSTCS
jgi:Flp pilus assembly protein TadG